MRRAPGGRTLPQRACTCECVCAWSKSICLYFLHFWKLLRIFPFGPSFMTRTELPYWFKAGFSSILWEFFPCNAQKDHSTHTNLIKQNIWKFEILCLGGWVLWLLLGRVGSVRFGLSRVRLDIWFLPPATKLGQGYIFTGVCDSVQGGVCFLWGRVLPLGEGASSGGGCFLPGWVLPLRGGVLPPGGDASCRGGAWCRSPKDGYCYGRYASYWNAFWFIFIFVRSHQSEILHSLIFRFVLSGSVRFSGPMVSANKGKISVFKLRRQQHKPRTAGFLSRDNRKWGIYCWMITKCILGNDQLTHMHNSSIG